MARLVELVLAAVLLRSLHVGLVQEVVRLLASVLLRGDGIWRHVRRRGLRAELSGLCVAVGVSASTGGGHQAACMVVWLLSRLHVEQHLVILQLVVLAKVELFVLHGVDILGELLGRTGLDLLRLLAEPSLVIAAALLHAGDAGAIEAAGVCVAAFREVEGIVRREW